MQKQAKRTKKTVTFAFNKEGEQRVFSDKMPLCFYTGAQRVFVGKFFMLKYAGQNKQPVFSEPVYSVPFKKAVRNQISSVEKVLPSK